MLGRNVKLLKLSTCGLAVLWPGMALAQIRIPDVADPLLANLALSDSAPERGMWSATAPWPLIGLHAALLPSGAVLTFGAAPGRDVQDGRVFAVWDPDRGLDPAAHTLLPNAQAVDSFCAGATNMVSGAVLLSGGNSDASRLSPLASTAFDPATRTANTIPAQLAYPRWYGTMITLPDGRPLIVGGGKPYVVEAYKNVAGALQYNDVSMIPEVYVAGSGWRTLPGAASRDAFGPDFNRWWYPRLWVTPRGSVFGVSSEKMWVMNPAGDGSIVSGTFKTAANTSSRPNIGPTSTAVMYDTGRILQVGGNGYANGHAMPSSAQATVFDVNGAGVAVSNVASMTYPRQWANATVLPTGRVLVTGGTRYADNAGGDAVMEAEIWNPATRGWTVAARAAHYRGYHSAAILLQNGTVLTTGGGAPGPVTNLNAEVYYPPYLFTRVNGRTALAPRPRLATISASQYAYGATATIELASGAAIASVAFLGLGQTTHSFDAGQRFQRLAFSQDGQTLRVTMPASANLAPPGYYQVVVVDQAGVPSRGVIVAMAAAAPPQPAAPPPDAQPTPQPNPQPAPQVSSLQPVALPDYRVRHAGFLGYVSPVNAGSSQLDRLDASFTVRAGLADAACLSFESANYPGHFLRHAGFRLRLNPNDNSELFRNDATFCQRSGLAGRGNSYESKNFPGHYLRVRGTEMWIDRQAGDATYANAASFNLVDAFR